MRSSLPLVSLLLAALLQAQTSNDDRRAVVPVSKAPLAQEKPSAEAEELVLRLGAGLPEGVALEEVRAQLLSWWSGDDPLRAIDSRGDALNGVLGELRLVEGLLEARFRFEEKPHLPEVGLLVQLWTEDESWWACARLDLERREARIVWQPCGRLEVSLGTGPLGSEHFFVSVCRPGNEPALPFFAGYFSDVAVQVGPLPAGEYVVLTEDMGGQSSDLVTVRVRPGRTAEVHPELETYSTGTLSGSVRTLSGERPGRFFVKLVGTSPPYRCLLLESRPVMMCAIRDTPSSWHLIAWKEELLEKSDVPAGTYWVQGERLDEELPLSFSTQRLAIPGEPLQVTVLDDERAPGLRLHLFDADSGAPLDAGETPATISVLRAGCPLAFERPVRSGQVFAGAELGLLAFDWQLELEGYATACGDESAFAAPDASWPLKPHRSIWRLTWLHQTLLPSRRVAARVERGNRPAGACLSRGWEVAFPQFALALPERPAPGPPAKPRRGSSGAACGRWRTWLASPPAPKT